MLKPSGKTIIVDQVFDGDEKSTSYINHVFTRVVAKKKKFTQVDFKYCTFDAAYLRECTFDSCDFTGSRFISSNLHGSRFSGCKFDYTTFERTLVDNNILETECPTRENLKLRFARTLRMNFHQLGDSESINQAILIELAATETHLYKCWNSKEIYYRQKYEGYDRFKAYLKWVQFKSLDHLWGNGESLHKLIRSTFVIIGSIFVMDLFFYKDLLDSLAISSSLMDAPQIFFGIKKYDKYNGLYLTLIQLIRLIMFALFMSILLKRLNRR